MQPELIYFLFFAAFFLIAINLTLTMRLIKTMRRIKLSSEQAAMPKEGEVIQPFAATLLNDNSPFHTHDLDNEAKVYLYLSTKCDKCKGKLPELSELMQASKEFGVSLWIISDEPEKLLRRFLQTTALAQHTLMVEPQVLETLNPQGASPFYQFIDQHNTLQTSGLIGDENWLTFREQLLNEPQAA